MTTIEIRLRAVKIARDLVGVGANPDDEEGRERYLNLIAPGESHQMRAEMALMSGCALVVPGVWRALGLHDPRLAAPYRNGTAVSRIMAIGRSADAWVPFALSACPSLGDAVLIGDGAAGGLEHFYTVVDVSQQGDVTTVESVDGGQRDDAGHQIISLKSRRWEGRKDIEPFASARVIQGWIDVAKLPIPGPVPSSTPAPTAAPRRRKIVLVK